MTNVSNVWFVEKADSRSFVVSRDGSQDSATLKYAAGVTESELLIRNLADSKISNRFRELYLQHVDFEPLTGGIWEITAEYGIVNREQSVIQLDTSGGSEHVTQSLATIARYGNAPDCQGAVNFDGESVQGADIMARRFAWNEQYRMSGAAFTPAYRITLFNSSDYDELERAASLLRVIPLLKRSRVLVSPPFKGTPEAYTPEKVKERLGVEMVAIADGRYDEVMANVDERAAKAEAKRWLDEAKGIVEPDQEDVLKAARASLTLDQLIAENRIDGLCVGTCMGWLSRGFPCLGFSRLNDRGIPAACDGDMDCLLTMLIFQHALNRAGFLGNAGGVDTAKNAFHLSHCSAPLRMEGPSGAKAPYLLRRHAEVRGGAVTEVHYRIGQEITFTKLVHLDTLLMFTGKIIEVPKVPKGEERGCRTELVAEVNNADSLLANWGGGALGASAKDYYASLHRVAYYGDHTQSIRHLAHLMGLKVVQEG